MEMGFKIIKVHYMHIWKCCNEIHYFVQLIYANKKEKQEKIKHLGRAKLYYIIDKAVTRNMLGCDVLILNPRNSKLSPNASWLKQHLPYSSYTSWWVQENTNFFKRKDTEMNCLYIPDISWAQINHST
jgi:hypothetical protein